MILYTREKRHFRGFRTNVRGVIMFHPAYIVGEVGDYYFAFVITHSPKRGGNHPNYRLKHNPKSSDPRPSYLRNNLILRPKKFFKKEPFDDLEMSEEDEVYIDYLLSKADIPKKIEAVLGPSFCPKAESPTKPGQGP